VPAELAVLCGGLGGARLALALLAAGRARDTVFVTNVGDDWEVGGLLVCPDTDAVTYALAGTYDEERGWGVRGDTFPGRRPGEPAWFSLGERDRAHCARRTHLLRAGAGLGEATARLCGDAGVEATVVPVTDDRVPTVVETAERPPRTLGFQEWLVRDRARPPVRAARWPAAASSAPAPAAVAALRDAPLVILASSSPVGSIAPALAVPGIAAALSERHGPTVALSPVTVARPPERSRDRHRAAARSALLASVGVAPTPEAVARWYGRLVSHVVLDPADAARADAVAATGAVPLVAPLLADDAVSRTRLVAVATAVG